MSTMANDLRRFGSDVQTFTRETQQLRTSYANLLANMKALQGMWTGEAHDALEERFMADYEILGTLVEHFEGLSKSLTNADQAYTKCENSVRQAIDGLSF